MNIVGTVECTTMAEFCIVIAAMVREGCTFEANACTRTIVLTGGF